MLCVHTADISGIPSRQTAGPTSPSRTSLTKFSLKRHYVLHQQTLLQLLATYHNIEVLLWFVQLPGKPCDVFLRFMQFILQVSHVERILGLVETAGETGWRRGNTDGVKGRGSLRMVLGRERNLRGWCRRGLTTACPSAWFSLPILDRLRDSRIVLHFPMLFRGDTSLERTLATGEVFFFSASSTSSSQPWWLK